MEGRRHGRGWGEVGAVVCNACDRVSFVSASLAGGLLRCPGIIVV